MFLSRNGQEEEEREGTADDIYCMQSVEERIQGQDDNTFDIFDDERSEDDM